MKIVKILSCIILLILLIFLFTNISYGFTNGQKVKVTKESYQYKERYTNTQMSSVIGYERDTSKGMIPKDKVLIFVKSERYDGVCQVKEENGDKYYYMKEVNLRAITAKEELSEEGRASENVLEDYKDKTDADFAIMSEDELASAAQLCYIAMTKSEWRTSKISLLEIYNRMVSIAREKGMKVENGEIKHEITDSSEEPTGLERWEERLQQVEEEIERENMDVSSSNAPIFYQPNKVTTGSSSEENLDDVIQDANDFIQSGKTDGIGTVDQSALQRFSGTLYNILLSIGVAAAVIVGAILGIKLMTSSVEEKADVKGLIIPYIVGCVVIFGGFTIWKVVVEILSGI